MYRVLRLWWLARKRARLVAKHKPLVDELTKRVLQGGVNPLVRAHYGDGSVVRPKRPKAIERILDESIQSIAKKDEDADWRV